MKVFKIPEFCILDHAMSGQKLSLSKAPIVEAVLDMDCDLQPSADLAALKSRAQDCFRDKYPTFQAQLVQQASIEAKPGAAPQMSVGGSRTQALQFLQDQGRQLVQVRAGGFSFNRLAPYTSLDDYLPEIQRTWQLYVGLASPIQIRRVSLRYINRILLPRAGRLDLNEYLKIGPRLPDEDKLALAGFFTQHVALEESTGHQATMVMASQPAEGDKLPIIFDICVSNPGVLTPEDWPSILASIVSLRGLKNRIFGNTLTQRCLRLFQN
jgi:uncharacterized protein (TIGR04255 family)